MKKFLLLFAATLVTIAGVLYLIMQVEFVQKLMYDKKADYLGTDRTIELRAKLDGTLVRTFRDKDTRIDLERDGILSAWLGKSKRKLVTDMDFIVIDNVKGEVEFTNKKQ